MGLTSIYIAKTFFMLIKGTYLAQKSKLLEWRRHPLCHTLHAHLNQIVFPLIKRTDPKFPYDVITLVYEDSQVER